jgi:hypothetical protein
MILPPPHFLRHNSDFRDAGADRGVDHAHEHPGMFVPE